MENITATVEFEPKNYDWISVCQKRQGVRFSEVMNRLLAYGIEVEQEQRPLPEREEIPKEQKLIIQCVVQSLLMLQDQYSGEPRDKAALQERAKELIHKTLRLEKSG